MSNIYIFFYLSKSVKNKFLFTMTDYPGQALTWTTLGQLCAALWDSQSQPVLIQPGIEPGLVLTPLTLRETAAPLNTVCVCDQHQHMSNNECLLECCITAVVYSLSKQILFVTCTEYNRCRPYSEMLTYKPLTNNAVKKNTKEKDIKVTNN